MAVVVKSSQEKFRGLRPLRSSSDLAQVAGLIESAFEAELDRGGREALQELKTLSYLGPFLLLFELLSPEFRRSFSGFVWEEEGRIVGNVTINQVGREARHWLISNIAVAKDYRRRGIARRLVLAALDYARHHGGEWASLQVRTDNEPAMKLYRSLGFEEMVAISDLKLQKARPVAIISTAGFTLRLSRPEEWRKEYQLVKASTSTKAQWVNPVRLSQFEPTLSRRLFQAIARLFSNQRTHRLVIDGKGGFVALLIIHLGRWESEHRLEIFIHPDYRGQLEEILVTSALNILSNFPSRPVSTRQTSDQPQLIETLKRYGFSEQRTLSHMRFDLTRPLPH
ncbi:MAG: GNAT family N-acetyltransferase [Anaerolineae bacterium]